ncbi:MAG: GAF domain-containing protein, partial [Acidobacteria bacterium]|nr:GAF domain-containing protein [Acidobacteriota bacterium]MCA1643781.1 GAF domain-containing protein [Acidobacteriota bacterium]
NELEVIDSVDGRKPYPTAQLEGQSPPTQLEELPGFLGRVARGELSVPVGTPAVEYDFREKHDEAPFLTPHNFRTLLAARVRVEPDIKFVLYVGDTSEDPQLGKADWEVLQRLGHQSAISLAKAISREQLSRTRDVAQIVAEAVASGDLDWTLRKVVEGIMKSMGCDAVSLHRLNREKQAFVVPPTMAGVANEAAAQREQRVDKGSAVSKIFRLPDNALEDDMYVAEDTPGDALMKGDFVRREGIVSSAAVLLRAKGEKIGVMFVNYRVRHVFTEDDRKNIKLFADQAAVATILARLYEEVNLQSTQEKISKQLNRDYEHARRAAMFHMVISLLLALLFAVPVGYSVYHLHGGEASNKAGALTMVFILVGSLGAELTNYIFAQKVESLYQRVDKFHSEMLQAGRFEQLLIL